MANETGLTKMQAAGHKAWATRRANNEAKASAATKAVAKSNSRNLDLAGTRKLRASVPTLVGHLKNAASVEYYYSADRSIIVINN